VNRRSGPGSPEATSAPAPSQRSRTGSAAARVTSFPSHPRTWRGRLRRRQRLEQHDLSTTLPPASFPSICHTRPSQPPRGPSTASAGARVCHLSQWTTSYSRMSDARRRTPPSGDRIVRPRSTPHFGNHVPNHSFSSASRFASRRPARPDRRHPPRFERTGLPTDLVCSRTCLHRWDRSR
jgi:hypothetical protein